MANIIDEDIKSGNFSQIYLLCGVERYLVRQYRNKLRDALTGGENDGINFSVFQGNDMNLKEVIGLAETLPFFSERRVILVEDSGLFKKSCEELADYLMRVPETTYFIFVEEEIDKRTKVYKTVKKQGRIAEFPTPKDEVLSRWIVKRLKDANKMIKPEALRLFLSRTGTDMEHIDKEMEKLICYCMDKELVEEEDVCAITTEQTENKIFDMVNAIVEQNQRKALSLYYDLLILKEPPMRILYLITRQFRILLHVKDMSSRGMDSRTMAKNAGVPEFALRKHVAQAKGFSENGLKEALSESADLEEAVKTGRMNDRMAVELLLIQYSANAAEKTFV